mgnify:FL=1
MPEGRKNKRHVFALPNGSQPSFRYPRDPGTTKQKPARADHLIMSHNDHTPIIEFWHYTA